MWSQRYSNFACRSIGPTPDGLRSIGPAKHGPSVSPARAESQFPSLVCSPIGQRDRCHFPRLSPVPAAFPKHLQALSSGGANGQKSPQKARSSQKLYTKAATKANPHHSLPAMSWVNTTPKILTTEPGGRFLP